MGAKCLNVDQKHDHTVASQAILEHFRQNIASFLVRLMTTDEMDTFVWSRDTRTIQGVKKQCLTSPKKLQTLKDSLQGDNICFLGQRWDTVGLLLYNNHSKLICLGQSEAGAGLQMEEELVKRSVVSAGHCLLTHSCHHTAEVGWCAFWSAETPCLFTWLAASDYHLFPYLKQTSEVNEIFKHWGCRFCCRRLFCSPAFRILSGWLRVAGAVSKRYVELRWEFVE
jgi:hypothetical protein